MNIRYKTIDLNKHYHLCYQFRQDSNYCSFGSNEGFEKFIAGYKERIEERLLDDNWHYFHVWNEQEIIGQLEFKSFSDRPSTGYIHLIYLVPQFRGLGIADELQQFISSVLRNQGCTEAMLSVSRTNTRAIRHYSRIGWKYLSPNPKHLLTDFYTLVL